MVKSAKNKVKVFNSDLIDAFTDSATDNVPKRKSVKILRDGKEEEATITSDNPKKSKVKMAQMSLGILSIIGFFVSIYLSSVNMTSFLISSVITIFVFALALILYFRNSYRKDKTKEISNLGGMFSNISPEDKRLLGLMLIAFVISGILMIIGYVYNTMNLEISLSIIGINELLVVVIVYDRVSSMKKETNPTKKQQCIPSFLIMQGILYGILIVFVFPLILGVDLLSYTDMDLTYYNSINIQFNICMVIVSLSGIVGILQMRGITNETSDYDKTALIRYLIMVLLPIVCLVLYPLTSSIFQQASIYEGAIGGDEYFNGVFVAIQRDQYTLVSMVWIILGAIVIMIGKSKGQSGTAVMSIGSLAMAGIPMIITIMAFIGQIEPPLIYTELFNEGFDNLIFAISYTTIIALALSLVGVFYELIPVAMGSGVDD